MAPTQSLPRSAESQSRSPDWADIAHDLSWLPFAYQPLTDAFVFARVDAALKEHAVFLDPRFLAEAPKSSPLRRSQAPAIATGPLHFIFHTAFCCSTLMARALDVPGVSSTLREPSILASFADHWSGHPADHSIEPAFALALDLLSRPAHAQDVRIIKASNAANHLAQRALLARPNSRLLVMHAPLEDFLSAVARRGAAGRSFARSLWMQFAPAIPLRAQFSAVQMMQQTDLQVAAYAWLMQTHYFQALAAGFPERVRTLSARALLANKQDALVRAGAFFGLRVNDWASIANGPVFRTHAKEAGRAFGEDEYRAQIAQVPAGHGDDIRETVHWARALAEHSGAPLDLGDTLLT